MRLYIRTHEGNTYEPTDLAEALQQFVGEDGYRLTIADGDVELVIRREGEWEEGIVPGVDKVSRANLTWRTERPQDHG